MCVVLCWCLHYASILFSLNMYTPYITRCELDVSSILVYVHVYSLVRNIACNAMRPEVHVNAYWQCKNRKTKYVPAPHVYMDFWSHHIADEDIVNQTYQIQCVSSHIVCCCCCLTRMWWSDHVQYQQGTPHTGQWTDHRDQQEQSTGPCSCAG